MITTWLEENVPGLNLVDMTIFEDAMLLEFENGKKLLLGLTGVFVEVTSEVEALLIKETLVSDLN